MEGEENKIIQNNTQKLSRMKGMNFSVEVPIKFPAEWYSIMKPQDTRDQKSTLLIFRETFKKF